MNMIANSTNLLDIFYGALSELRNIDTVLSSAEEARKQVAANRAGRAGLPFYALITLAFGYIPIWFAYSDRLPMLSAISNVLTPTREIPQSYKLLLVSCGVVLIVLAIYLMFWPAMSKKGKREKEKRENRVLDLEAEYRSLYEKSPNLRMIPADYRTDLALSTMARYIENSRASTWERCVELYEEQVHRWKVEQNTAEAAEYAKSAAKNARRAALFAFWSRY